MYNVAEDDIVFAKIDAVSNFHTVRSYTRYQNYLTLYRRHWWEETARGELGVLQLPPKFQKPPQRPPYNNNNDALKILLVPPPNQIANPKPPSSSI